MFEVDLSSSMGRHNFDDGATQLICRGDTTPMLGRRNFGWGDITWGDKAMGRHNLHSISIPLQRMIRAASVSSGYHHYPAPANR